MVWVFIQMRFPSFLTDSIGVIIAEAAKGGSGLGLAIVRHIANLYQATVEVQSQPGEGSTFIVSLPNS